MAVQPKKHLGQHFLTDKNICKKIADVLPISDKKQKVLEIGPGTGALTDFLLEREDVELTVMEIDKESVDYLQENKPQLAGNIHFVDFLKTDIRSLFPTTEVTVIGNFPYNISSQILFNCIEHVNQIPQIIGMFQKEVAERVAEPPGTKAYGVLSVMMQTFYTIEYCFTVSEQVFNPPPKVKSGVIYCKRKEDFNLPISFELYKKVIKSTFNQRRKTIRNGLKNWVNVDQIDHAFLSLRPERLSVEDFIELTKIVADHQRIG